MESETPFLAGRVAVVTGASSGIGAEVARALAGHGADVVVLGRHPERTRGVADALPGAGSHRHVLADFASLVRVREVAEQLSALPRIDLLINNAGLWMPQRTLTDDGYETTFAVNHLAPFVLTVSLLERLLASRAHVIHVSSHLHYTAGRERGPGWQLRHALESFGLADRADRARLDLDDLQLERHPYQGMDAYARSKLAQIAFSNELAARYPSLRSNAVHPGNVNTRVSRSSALTSAILRLAGPLLRTPEQGADTVVWCATAPEAAGITGAYLADRQRVRPAKICEDVAFRAALWRQSAELTGAPDAPPRS